MESVQPSHRWTCQSPRKGLLAVRASAGGSSMLTEALQAEVEAYIAAHAGSEMTMAAAW